MPIVQADELQSFTAGIFTAYGASAADAATVAAALVKASLLGHDSHGLLAIGRYVDKINRGTLHPAAQPTLRHARGSVAVVDGCYGFGQVTARFGVQRVIELARTHGIAAVALSRTNHIGRLGDYAEQISQAGFVALIVASGAGRGGSVAPHGGRERVFGTNPLAWGLPVQHGRGPLIADFSTSAIPEGKVGMARARRESLPPGAVLDRAGRASADPESFYAGGSLLPFGGHKGYSLVLFIEVVASLLAGSVPSSSAEYRPGNPTLLFAIDIEAFLPVSEYHRHTEALLRRIESSQPAEGFERVLLPNAVELAIAARRRKEGIPVPDVLWAELQELGRKANVPWPRQDP